MRIPAPNQPQRMIGGTNGRNRRQEANVADLQKPPRGTQAAKASVFYGREEPPVRVREKQSGDALVHVRGIIRPLDVSHGPRNMQAFFKGLLGGERHAGSGQGAVPNEFDFFFGNVRQKATGNSLAEDRKSISRRNAARSSSSVLCSPVQYP